MARSWPLVGRDEELALLTAALDDDRSHAVVVSGTRGVGKSRLLNAARDMARDRGWEYVAVMGSRSAAAIPFGAFAHLLPPGDARLGPLEYLRQASRSIADRGSAPPLVVTIDDAHALDHSSAALVQQLSGRPRVFLVVAVRSGEAPPDPVVALWKEGDAARIDLDPLGFEDVARLTRAALGGPVDAVTQRALWTWSEGVPLVLAELVLAGLEAGRLARVGGMWSARGPVADLPRVVELVESQLGSLDAEEREVLETVALAEPLEAALLEGLASGRAVRSVERRNLLAVVDDEGRVNVRLAHPLHGEVLRGQLPPLQGRGIRRRLARALDSTGGRRRGDAVRLAGWRLLSSPPATPQLLLAGPHAATTALEQALARGLARRALEEGGGRESTVLLAQALLDAGDYRGGDELLRQAEDGSRGDAERVVATAARAGNLFWSLGERDQAREVVETALGAVRGQEAVDELDALAAGLLAYEGRPHEAISQAGAVLERPGVEEAPRLRAALALAPAKAALGRVDEALALADRFSPVAAAFRSRLPEASRELAVSRVLSLWWGGRLREAAEVARVNHDEATMAGDLDGSTLWAALNGRVALARGMAATAVRWLSDAIAMVRQRDRHGLRPWYLAALAHAHALSGDEAGAAAALAEAEQLRGRLLPVLVADLDVARLWVAAVRGDRDEAVGIGTRAAERARASSQHGMEGAVLHDVARLGRPSAVRARLHELTRVVEGEAVPVFASHAAALVSQDAAALARLSAAFERLGAVLCAAEAAAEAARAYRRLEVSVAAHDAAVRAAALAEACEGTLSPSLSLLDEPEELTPREREVASLAAQGLSSRVIAERLVVSVRTVDNHLRHVYLKLGVGGRKELSARFAGLVGH